MQGAALVPSPQAPFPTPATPCFDTLLLTPNPHIPPATPSAAASCSRYPPLAYGPPPPRRSRSGRCAGSCAGGRASWSLWPLVVRTGSMCMSVGLRGTKGRRECSVVSYAIQRHRPTRTHRTTTHARPSIQTKRAREPSARAHTRTATLRLELIVGEGHALSLGRQGLLEQAGVEAGLAEKGPEFVCSYLWVGGWVGWWDGRRSRRRGTGRTYIHSIHREGDSKQAAHRTQHALTRNPRQSRTPAPRKWLQG